MIDLECIHVFYCIYIYTHINNKDTLDCWVQGALLMIPEAGLGGSPKKPSIYRLYRWDIRGIYASQVGIFHDIPDIIVFFFERSVACTPVLLVERWMVYANYQDMGGL
jgi:hypothetical protein